MGKGNSQYFGNEELSGDSPFDVYSSPGTTPREPVLRTTAGSLEGPMEFVPTRGHRVTKSMSRLAENVLIALKKKKGGGRPRRSQPGL